MKQYSVSFYFPNQDTSRKNFSMKVSGGNPGVAAGNAWQVLKKDGLYKGKRNLDEQVQISVHRIDTDEETPEEVKGSSEEA